MDSRALLPLFLLAVLTPGPVYADNWVSLSGAETLRELVSGATAEIELKPGLLEGSGFRSQAACVLLRAGARDPHAALDYL